MLDVQQPEERTDNGGEAAVDQSQMSSGPIDMDLSVADTPDLPGTI